MPSARLLALAVCLALGAATDARAATFTVTNAGDAGFGSLRWAIDQANTTPGTDVIGFFLGADRSIDLASPLPGITTPMTIDGTSQPGWGGTPVVELNGAGAGAGAIGLMIWSSGVTVKGLVLNRFGGDAIAFGSGSSGGTVSGCWVGLDATGTLDLGNGGSGVSLGGTGLHTVGGHAAADRNVLAGNTWHGVSIQSPLNFVVGNRIGTNAAGTAGVPNGSYGIRVLGKSNRIGDGAAGGGNLVSGNGSTGISLEDTGNMVLGNVVGLDATGTAALGNVGGGVTVGANDCVIGGDDPLERNVLSGNVWDGLAILGAASDTLVLGNRIGTDVTGTTAVGNGGYGIRVFGTHSTIGGSAPGQGNVVSGNARGVALETSAADSVVQGNRLGTNAAGTAVVASGAGLDVSSPGNLIGGPAPGAGNVLAGSAYHGLVLFGAAATGNTVQGNHIGVASNGTTPLPNLQLGVFVLEASGNLIGGTTAGEGNVIAHNGWYGVFVDTGVGNRILRNAIFANGSWGIDLAPYGPTPADALDADGGPNRRQNAPVITSALVANGSTTVEGVLDGVPLTQHRLEIFANDACDPSGFGQGRTFLGATTVATDAGGHATWSIVGPGTPDPWITATATTAGGDTSEFSPCAATIGPNPGTLQFTQSQFIGYESDVPGTLVTVGRVGGAQGTVSVQYATGVGSATPGGDYGATSGTLTFAPGEVLKQFVVPMVLDGASEGQEEIPLALTAPTGGATLGAWATSKIILINHDPSFPTSWVSDAAVTEGDAGPVDVAVTITVSERSSPITVDWTTAPGTAADGADFTGTSGQLVFQPGDGPKQVHVAVLGDVADEGAETFFVKLTGVFNGTVTDGLGEVTIVDDDGPSAAGTCGDGTVDPAAEQCDDGNVVPGDGCEAGCVFSPVCTGGTTIVKPKIVVAKLGGAPGDERITFSGGLVFAPGLPAGFTPVDSITRGAQLLIEDTGAAGPALVALTHQTTPIPGGPLGPSPCLPAKKDGWKADKTGTSYAYANGSASFAAAGCTPGAAQHLTKLAVKDKRAKSGTIDVKATVAGATLGVPTGPLRATVVLAADAVAGANGACGATSFVLGQCTLNAKGTTLTCR